MDKLGVVNVAVQILPIAVEKPELYKVVDECIQLINTSGLKYIVGAFETTIEGDYDKVMALIKQLQLHAHAAGIKHLITNLKIQTDVSGDVKIEDKTGKYK